MHSHLVSVEVSVECCTYQRMQLNSLSFNKFRLECLYPKTVKCRSAVKKNRMSFKDILKNIPYNRILAIYNFLCRFNCLDNAAFDKFSDNEWLIKLSSHIFR